MLTMMDKIARWSIIDLPQFIIFLLIAIKFFDFLNFQNLI